MRRPLAQAENEEEETTITLDGKEVVKRVKWTPTMDEMLIVQVNSKGVAAFVRGPKANTKDMADDEKWNRDDVWLDPKDGIMTELWNDENFKQFTKPKYESVVQHITQKETGLFAKNAHLWAQGQRRPAMRAQRRRCR